MDLQVFQIDMSRDTQRVKFMPLETAMQRTGEVDASLYQKVFDGELDCDDLEEAYEILNSEPPSGYTGHSLSVSDVVKTADGFFYCDSYEFKPIEFDESQSEDMEVIGGPVMME